MTLLGIFVTGNGIRFLVEFIRRNGVLSFKNKVTARRSLEALRLESISFYNSQIFHIKNRQAIRLFRSLFRNEQHMKFNSQLSDRKDPHKNTQLWFLSPRHKRTEKRIHPEHTADHHPEQNMILQFHFSRGRHHKKERSQPIILAIHRPSYW